MSDPTRPSWWRRLLGLPAPRTVFLVTTLGDLTVARAHQTQAGWVAYYDTRYRWSAVVLLADGKTAGTPEVKAWFPRSGWPVAESPTGRGPLGESGVPPSSTPDASFDREFAWLRKPPASPAPPPPSSARK